VIELKLTQLAEWSLFVIDYFIPTAFRNYAKHCSETVCTLLLDAASAVPACRCMSWTSWHLGKINPLTSRRLPAPRC